MMRDEKRVVLVIWSFEVGEEGRVSMQGYNFPGLMKDNNDTKINDDQLTLLEYVAIGVGGNTQDWQKWFGIFGTPLNARRLSHRCSEQSLGTAMSKHLFSSFPNTL